MKTPADPIRLALGPLLLATALGPAGFAAGWWLREGPGEASAAREAREGPPVAETRPSPPHGATQSTHAGAGGTRANPPAPAPAEARARLAAWVDAGCPGGDTEDIWLLLKAWAAAEPWEALAFIHQAPRFRNRTRAYTIPLAIAARTSAPAMLAWLEREITEEHQHDVILAGTIRELTADAPVLAIELATTHLPENRYLFSETIKQLARTNASLARDWFDRLAPDSRAYCADDLASAWLDADEAGATTWCLAQAEEKWSERVLNCLVRHYMDHNPERLSEILIRPEIPTGIRAFAVTRIASSRPDLALDLIPTLPPKAARHAVGYMFDDLFSDDPQAALDIGRSMLEPAELASRLRTEWRQWLASDRPAATAWAAALGDPDLRHQLDLEATTMAITRDPASFLATTPAGAHTPETAGLLKLALSCIAESDPAEAIRWAAVHDEAITPDVASTIGLALLHEAADQVKPWIQSIPRGAARDAACFQLMTFAAGRREPSQDLGLLDFIDDPDQKTKARFETFTALHRRDAAAAEQWLAGQPLHPDVRASWRAIVKTGEFAGCGTYPH